MKVKNSRPLLKDFSSFEPIKAEELRKILGGGGEPTPEQVHELLSALSGIFVRDTSDRNMTDELWKEFYNEYSTLATTSVGYDLLSQIADSGKKIVVDDRGAYSNDDKQYHPEYQDGRGDSGGNLHLGGVGGLTVPDTSNPNANPYYELAHNFGLVAHELYHADVYLTTGDPKEYSDSIRSELDAFIFEEMAEQEYDAARHLAVADLNKSYALLDDQVYDYNGGPVYSDSTIAFDTAWNDIFKNHNFSLENYNTLINTFQQGSHTGSQYRELSVTPVDEKTFESSTIDKFYTTDYSRTSYYEATPLYSIRSPTDKDNPTDAPSPYQEQFDKDYSVWLEESKEGRTDESFYDWVRDEDSSGRDQDAYLVWIAGGEPVFETMVPMSDPNWKVLPYGWGEEGDWTFVTGSYEP